MTATYFETAAAFRKWLQKHHKRETELLVGFYKVGSGKPSLSWSDSVDQALCFGWIDGVRKSIDEKRYSIRFTPRRSSSIWSAINIKKVAELQEAGLMKPEGMKAFGLRQEGKSAIYSHEIEPHVLAASFVKEFKKNKLAWKYFSSQAPSYQKVMTHWIMSAKQEATRQTRFEKTILVSEQGKRMQ